MNEQNSPTDITNFLSPKIQRQVKLRSFQNSTQVVNILIECYMQLLASETPYMRLHSDCFKDVLIAIQFEYQNCPDFYTWSTKEELADAIRWCITEHYDLNRKNTLTLWVSTLSFVQLHLLFDSWIKLMSNNYMGQKLDSN